jgi:hypothetical protein
MNVAPGPYSVEVHASASASPKRLSDFEDVTVVAGQVVSLFGASEAARHVMPVDLSHGDAGLTGCWWNGSNPVTITLARETDPGYTQYGRWLFNGLSGTAWIDGFTFRKGCDATGCGNTGTVAPDGLSFTITGTTYTFQHTGPC